MEAVVELEARTSRTCAVQLLGYSPGAMSAEPPLPRDEVLALVRARVLAAARAWLSPADAEDVAQETLLLLSTKYGHVAAAEELLPLAARIVRFKRLAHWRKAARRRELGETAPPAGEDRDADGFAESESGAPGPEATARARQRLALLLAAAARLDGRCREILRRKLQGASFVEIAAELGRPVNTVYSWDYRCHQRLRTLLGERWSFVSGLEEAE